MSNLVPIEHISGLLPLDAFDRKFILAFVLADSRILKTLGRSTEHAALASGKVECSERLIVSAAPYAERIEEDTLVSGWFNCKVVRYCAGVEKRRLLGLRNAASCRQEAHDANQFQLNYQTLTCRICREIAAEPVGCQPGVTGSEIDSRSKANDHGIVSSILSARMNVLDIGRQVEPRSDFVVVKSLYSLSVIDSEERCCGWAELVADFIHVPSESPSVGIASVDHAVATQTETKEPIDRIWVAIGNAETAKESPAL